MFDVDDDVPSKKAKIEVQKAAENTPPEVTKVAIHIKMKNTRVVVVYW